MDDAMRPSHCLKRNIHYPSLSAMFNLLYSSMNQELFENTSAIKVATMKKIRTISITQRKPSRTTTKSTLFTVSKDEWNTKEDTGKSLKDALHVLRYVKKHLLG